MEIFASKLIFRKTAGDPAEIIGDRECETRKPYENRGASTSSEPRGSEANSLHFSSKVKFYKVFYTVNNLWSRGGCPQSWEQGHVCARRVPNHRAGTKHQEPIDFFASEWEKFVFHLVLTRKHRGVYGGGPSPHPLLPLWK